MERRILDSLQEEESPSLLKSGGLGVGLSRLGRQPSAVHIGFSKPQTPAATSAEEAPPEPLKRNLSIINFEPPQRHASTLEAVTPASAALLDAEAHGRRPESPKRRTSAIWMDDEKDPEEVTEGPLRRRSSIARRGSRSGVQLDPNSAQGDLAPSFSRRRSSVKPLGETSPPKEESSDSTVYPPPIVRRKSSVKPPPDSKTDEQERQESPKARPTSGIKSSMTPLRQRMRQTSVTEETMLEELDATESRVPSSRVRSPVRRSSIQGLPTTPETAIPESPLNVPAPTIMQQSVYGQRVLQGQGLAQIVDGVALEIARPVTSEAYDDGVARRGIVRTAFPNPEVLAYARLLARNPNADVKAMVAAYDPYPLVWPGPEAVVKDRQSKGRPLEDQWAYKAAPRFIIPNQTKLGPGTYNAMKSVKHTPNAATIVFKKGAPRFMTTSLSTATTSNVAPGSYELREIKVPKGHTPWVIQMGSILQRSAAERPKVMIGSDMGLIETFGNVSVPIFKGSHITSEPAKSESDTSSRRRNLKITAMHPFSKCYLASSLQQPAQVVPTQLGRPSVMVPGAPSNSSPLPQSLSPPLVMPQPRRSFVRAAEE
ncbi:hypothetical protein BC829DRAFT_381626 [Chytridium lagenaria]|nr:hypothetical protein BC829DRAFT_381626 [Chytridium lagenaria]